MKISSDVIRIYKIVHTWIGIVCGFALFIAFYAGALTMFKDPIARWASPPAVGVASVSLEDAQTLIEKVVAVHPQAVVQLRLELQDAENVPARVTWYRHPFGPDGEFDFSRRDHWWATLRPDGSLHATQEDRSELAQFINHVHQTAGIPGRVGRETLGIVSLLYAVALVSGVIVLLPTLVKDFFVIRVGRNLKRMWLDAHNVVGIVSLPFHLVMALTSVAFLSGPASDGLTTLAYDGQERAQQAALIERLFITPDATGRAAAMLAPQELLRRASQAYPDFKPDAMHYRQPGDAAALVRITGTQHGYVMDTGFGAVTLSAVTGEVLGSTLPSDQTSWMRATFTLAGLHFGQYAGAATLWLYFFLGLAGAFLFYGGNLLWVETRRKAQRKGGELPTQRRDTYLLAAGTVGVCLGCVAGLSLTIVAGKWLHGYVADLNAWHEYVYFAVFFGAVGWAFLRGAARAAVELLWLSAVFTLAIPLTTLAALLVPSLGLWAHTSAAALGVDATAFVGALCFAWMARATARRVKHGPADSVWSARAAEAVPQVSVTAREA